MNKKFEEIKNLLNEMGVETNIDKQGRLNWLAGEISTNFNLTIVNAETNELTLYSFERALYDLTKTKEHNETIDIKDMSSEEIVQKCKHFIRNFSF